MKNLKFYYYNVFGDGNRTDEESCEAWIPDEFWVRLARYYETNPDGDALQEPEFKDVWEMCWSAAVEKNLEIYEWGGTLYYYSFFYWPKDWHAGDNRKKRNLDYLQNGLKYVIRDDFPKEDLCDERKIEDEIYDLIRSEEVREHAKKHWESDARDMVLLIHFAFAPIRKRYELLKRYASTVENEDDRNYAEGFVKVYELVLNHIFHPAEKVLYICQLFRPSTEGRVTENEAVKKGFDQIDDYLRGWFDSFKDLIKSEVEPYEHMEPGYFFKVNVVSIRTITPSDDKVSFYMESVDGNTEITRFFTDEKWLMANGISEEVCMDLFFGDGGRHSYPFANFSNVLLQTPLMEKPVKCTIYSDLDGNYCWYHWLVPRIPNIKEYPEWDDIDQTDPDWTIDMSYWMIGQTGNYNAFDWIKSDSEDNNCYPEDMERIKRSWKNIQHMIHWRTESEDGYHVVKRVSCSLWPEKVDTVQFEGRLQNVLLIRRADRCKHPVATAVTDSEFDRIAMEHTGLFEESIQRICGIECKVVYMR